MTVEQVIGRVSRWTRGTERFVFSDTIKGGIPWPHDADPRLEANYKVSIAIADAMEMVSVED
jgi:hypothetical protein